ncbi:MAG: hypothetical protein EF806_00080 [Candidatus Methanoliparum thermophilum]|uniref:Uncharacterized protein n=1 Tax=Methanoliparum thermophilum TaxID=2491083 RepID=A0A520KU23_METT2|nr:hypothetical protein [Candidatus Methanoliparum sp. LAM-1]RZN65623.1 MAG: hypothetical protein EF806_00080 [Candidatus Methanoliparum thermophilum]BDC36501.1 hypothetical protein MTLP_11830 [Candidatus Methanoliparum sp. LAM-1]
MISTSPDKAQQQIRKIFVAAIVCMVLFISVAAAQSPLRDLIDRIFGREKETQITEIKDILEDPEKYYNKTITVEGIFGDVRSGGGGWAGGTREGYEWMEGGMYGIYDEEGNSIAMWVYPNRDELEKKAIEMNNGTYETYSFAKTYDMLLNESWNRLVSFDGKKIRATGYIDTDIMGASGYLEPVITVLDTDIEVVK